MQLFTIGFTKKSAEEFFRLIMENEIDILVDVRLNNQSQLAGFTKGKDLEYFLQKICHCKYEHNLLFAPTKEILREYRDKKITWEDYVVQYNNLITERNMVGVFCEKYSMYNKILLLCSEQTEKFCHRRLLAEKLKEACDNLTIIHL